MRKLEVAEVFFESLPELVYKGILAFEERNIPKEDIMIFIPSHIMRMLGNYVNSQYRMPVEEMRAAMHGVKIIDGYENAVIISYKYNMLHGLEPIKIPIP